MSACCSHFTSWISDSSPLQVGIIATATLCGSGLLTLLVGLHAYRYHYRTLLLAATILMAGTGLGFAMLTDFWPLLMLAIVGTLNPSSGNVSVFLPLEHAVLSRVVGDKERTAVFARYSLVGSLIAALGSLAAALPTVMAGITGLSVKASIQAMFVFYALLGPPGGPGLPGFAKIAGIRSPATQGPFGQVEEDGLYARRTL